jgi:hypothetical protein
MLPISGAVQGDAGSRDDLAKLGTGFDIVIDDASHASEHQQVALGWLANHMNADGLYIIEDLHWQPEWSSGPLTRNVLGELRATGQFRSPHVSNDEALTISHRVKQIRFYDSLCPRNVLEHGEAMAVLRFE